MHFWLLLKFAGAAVVTEEEYKVTLPFAVDQASKQLHTAKYFSKVQVQSDAPNAAGLNAVLAMGSNKQNVALLLDTGSDLFWIRKKSCSSCFTSDDFDAGSFDTSASTSYQASAGNFVTESLGSYAYGDGTTLVDCELGVDQMVLGAMNVPNQTFCAVNQMSSPNVPINDGILGLSIPTPKVGAANIFNINGVRRYFGFWYHTVSGNTYDGGKITLGGDDASLRAGEVTSVPASSATGRFTISLTQVSIGDALLGSGNTSVLVDTGTVATLLPTSLANAINAKLAPLIKDNCGANNQETISFTFGTGVAPITMKLNQLLITDSGTCYSYIKAGSSLSILGSWFLQAFYTGFDYDASTISFAKPAVISSFVAPVLPNEAKKGTSSLLIGGIVVAGILVLVIIIYFAYQQYRKKSAPAGVYGQNQPQMQQQYQYPQYPNAGQPMAQGYPSQPNGPVPRYINDPMHGMPPYPQQPNTPLPQPPSSPEPQYPQQAHAFPTQQYPQFASQRPQSAQYPSTQTQPEQFSSQRPLSDQYPQIANQGGQPHIVTVERQ